MAPCLWEGVDRKWSPNSTLTFGSQECFSIFQLTVLDLTAYDEHDGAFNRYFLQELVKVNVEGMLELHSWDGQTHNSNLLTCLGQDIRSPVMQYLSSVREITPVFNTFTNRPTLF